MILKKIASLSTVTYCIFNGTIKI